MVLCRRLMPAARHRGCRRRLTDEPSIIMVLALSSVTV